MDSKMNDQEFKKKLETILDNLYKLDREVKSYLEMRELPRKNGDYMEKPSQNKQDIEEKYKN